MIDAPYDSEADTRAHIARVRVLLLDFARDLGRRADLHDRSKLGPEEKPAFDRETPLLKRLVYGSDEYKASLERLGPALQHHYAHNSHHPEHHERGVSGMTLMDLVEMFIDWKAASERQAGTGMNIGASARRFGISRQLADIFRNTARELGWPMVEPEPTPVFDCIADLKDGEPYFVLRGQDELASSSVRVWARSAAMLNTCPTEKIQSALAVAEAMERWPGRKEPD